MFTTALTLIQFGSQQGLGIFRFFVQGGPMGKLVLGVLVLFSLGSWAIVLGKLVHFSRAHRQSEKFMEAFHRSQRFSEVNAMASKLGASPLVGIFQAGYAEIDSQIKNAPEPERTGEKRAYRISSIIALERTLARAVNVELQTVTRWTGFLATTAAATPFIAVAPGIAEALINTAAGLAAAIPALVAYNYFSQHLRRLRTRMQDFVLEFLNLAERNFT
jgi:biopolymer transport protein TolQ